MNKFYALLIACFSGLSFLLSVLDVDDEVAQTFPSLAPFVPYTVYAVFALTLLSFVLGIAFLIASGIHSYNTRTSKLSKLGSKDCGETDLEALFRLAHQNLPTYATFEQTKAALAHNKKCIQKIIDHSQTPPKIVGYVFVLPLTNRGVDRIENKSIEGTLDDLSLFQKKSFPSNRPYYIGALVGENKLAKAKAIRIVEELCKRKKVTRVFAKAATPDGLRLLRRKGFRPASEEDLAELHVYFTKSLN